VADRAGTHPEDGMKLDWHDKQQTTDHEIRQYRQSDSSYLHVRSVATAEMPVVVG